MVPALGDRVPITTEGAKRIYKEEFVMKIVIGRIARMKTDNTRENELVLSVLIRFIRQIRGPFFY